MRNSVVEFLRRKASSFVALSALLVFLSSCLNDDKAEVTPVPLGYVSIYHAAPDAPSLDIIVDSNRINTNPFEYSEHSGYLNFYTGNRNLKFSAVNAANVLVDTSFSVVEGKSYSVFVINTLPRLETLVVTDSAAAPAAGKAMLRFVHLSPDAPAINVTEGSNNIFEDASFKKATDFVEVDAKNYSFELKSSSNSEVLLSAKNINIQQGGYYTIITRGFKNAPAGNTNVLSVEVL
jgi:hypothetical protein